MLVIDKNNSMKKIHINRHLLLGKNNLEAGGLELAQTLAKEIESGNNEYKFKLCSLTDSQMNHRNTQLNWRLNEGNNEAVYQIGVEDDGNPLGLSSEELNESLMNLRKMADANNCSMIIQQYLKGEIGITAKVLLKRKERLKLGPVQVSVSVAGSENSGKNCHVVFLLLF